MIDHASQERQRGWCYRQGPIHAKQFRFLKLNVGKTTFQRFHDAKIALLERTLLETTSPEDAFEELAVLETALKKLDLFKLKAAARNARKPAVFVVWFRKRRQVRIEAGRVVHASIVTLYAALCNWAVGQLGNGACTGGLI